MYVTRPLSLYRRDPSILSNLTVQEEGPNSGYLVITDEESEVEDTCCWGACKVKTVKNFPFPSNKITNVTYIQSTLKLQPSDELMLGQTTKVSYDTVWFIPALDQPLSSNRYYVVIASGKHQGQTCTCSREEDKVTCCFCFNSVKDAKPRVLDHRDIYQQVEISKGGTETFVAKSVAPDGFPPWFLRRKGWTLRTTSSYDCQLGEALGLNDSIRMRLPDLPTSNNKYSTPVVVGKWYCPCVFIIMEGISWKDQMKKSLFYEMTLERTWKEIYTCENNNTANNVVAVNVTVQKEAIQLFGDEEAVKDERGDDGFIIWFKPKNGSRRLGLSLAIVEKMRWIQEKGGWVGGGERDVNVEKEFKGEQGWMRFGCFVLVERFALRKMDGTLMLTYDYRHTHQIQSKWNE